HAAGRPGDHRDGRGHGERVEVRHLVLGNGRDLVPRYGTHLLAVGLGGTGLDLGGFQELDGGRRRLDLEVEGLVLEDGVDHRHDLAGDLLRAGVEPLAEFHDVDALRTEGRTNRGGRVSGTAFDLQLDVGFDFLCHNRLDRECELPGDQEIFSTCMKLSSTSVPRPNIFTMTFSFFFSSLISLMSPTKSLNGPSMILTISPSMNGSTMDSAMPC